MSPIRMFSVKLFDPTITGPDEPVPELPPEDDPNPQPLNRATSAVIITNVKVSFFMIFLFSLRLVYRFDAVALINLRSHRVSPTSSMIASNAAGMAPASMVWVSMVCIPR